MLFFRQTHNDFFQTSIFAPKLKIFWKNKHQQYLNFRAKIVSFFGQNRKKINIFLEEQKKSWKFFFHDIKCLVVEVAAGAITMPSFVSTLKRWLVIIRCLLVCSSTAAAVLLLTWNRINRAIFLSCPWET